MDKNEKVGKIIEGISYVGYVIVIAAGFIIVLSISAILARFAWIFMFAEACVKTQ